MEFSKPQLRAFALSDAEALAGVYRDAVRRVAPAFYSEEEVNAWALYPEEIEPFRERLALGTTLVVLVDSRIEGFGQLEPDHHVAFLYCSGAFNRRGLGTLLYRQLEAIAIARGTKRLTTDPSRISRSFFAKQGFVVAEIEHVPRYGVIFERFKMTKVLGQKVSSHD